MLSGFVDGWNGVGDISGWATDSENTSFTKVELRRGQYIVASAEARLKRPDFDKPCGFTLNIKNEILSIDLLNGAYEVFAMDAAGNWTKLPLYKSLTERIQSMSSLIYRLENYQIFLQNEGQSEKWQGDWTLEPIVVKLLRNIKKSLITISNDQFSQWYRFITLRFIVEDQSSNIDARVYFNLANGDRGASEASIEGDTYVALELAQSDTCQNLIVELSHSSNSDQTVSIHLTGMMHPPIYSKNITPLYKLPTSERSNGWQIPFVATTVQSGLINRLSPLLSMARNASVIGCDLYVWWGASPDCAATFEDLFDMEATGFRIANPKELSKPFGNFCNFEKFHETAIPYAEFSNRGIVVHSFTFLNQLSEFRCGSTSLVNVMAPIVPSKKIRKFLHNFEHIDFTRVLGVHIRKPYKNSIFSEAETTIFTHDDQFYANIIKDIVAATNFFTKVFICSNDLDAVDYIRQSLDIDVFEFKKTTTDNSRDAEAVQQAFVDISLLSRCGLLLSHENSTWGKFASVVGKSPLIQIRGSYVEEAPTRLICRQSGQIDQVIDHHLGMPLLVNEIFNSLY